LITPTSHALNQEKQPSLSGRHAGDDFRQLTSERLTVNASLEIEEENEAAVKFFSDTIQVGMQPRS
jgi:hypothetical protein